MCLSNVYNTKEAPEMLLMKNVALIECENGIIRFTDLLGRRLEIEGELIKADLTGGTVIVAVKDN